MYHSVGKEENNQRFHKHLYNHISIDVTDFEKQLLYLIKRGHTFISFRDIPSLVLGKIKKPTIIYFDDGFKDTLENAIPILRKYNIPAMFFLVTGILDRTHILWTILLKEALMKKRIIGTEQSAIIEKIKTGTELERDKYMQLFSIKDYNYLFEIFLSWDEVRYLAKSSFEIGSHGKTHFRLTECNADELRNEIFDSKKKIELNLHKEINTFSLPYGRGNDLIVGELQRIGYKYVVSKGKGLNKTENLIGSLLYLNNISPKPNDSLKMFKLRLYALNFRQ
jgi:peptidoglycan/xylan/chitin deacetylase (PgdA/CDA1 family)